MKRAGTVTEALRTLEGWLAESEAVLVGAGAGLSADAGYDFSDERAFARAFPGLAAQGYRSRLEFIARVDLPPELRWGYYLAHVREVRFEPGTNALYQALRGLLEGREHFVLTTNADGLFVRNGFAEDRVTTPQGDYARWQCLRPCTRETWPTEDLIARFLPRVDPATQRLPRGEVPRCPRCGGDTFLNVRGGDWFVEEPYVAGWERYRAWLSRFERARLLVLEVGSGFNTPTWIRWPCERIVRANPDARLARLNLLHPEVPSDLGARALGVGARVTDVLTPLARSLAPRGSAPFAPGVHSLA